MTRTRNFNLTNILCLKYAYSSQDHYFAVLNETSALYFTNLNIDFINTTTSMNSFIYIHGGTCRFDHVSFVTTLFKKPIVVVVDLSAEIFVIFFYVNVTSLTYNWSCNESALLHNNLFVDCTLRYTIVYTTIYH
jgi:hypothetical protein